MLVEVYRSIDGLTRKIHSKSTFNVLIMIEDMIRVMVFKSIVLEGTHRSQTAKDHYLNTVLILVCIIM